MIGGYQILDLRGLNLQISASASNITDPYVLKQLLSLRDHIDKAYNFNKPLVNQLKPVLIRFRDKKNGEKTEGATFGEMSVVGNYYTFKITGRISGQFTLIINVAFHEVTNAYGNKEWLINTATIQLADASDVLEGDIDLEGDLSVGGDLEVIGDVTGGENSKFKIMDKITDADGNSRFISGEITKSTAGVGEKVEFAYAKWTLSGSHLMLVCMFKVLENFTASGTSLGYCFPPHWLNAKIYPMASTNHVAVIDATYGYYPNNLSASTGSIRTYLAKVPNSDEIDITIEGGNLEADKYYRVVFDLVID